jgi:hypothetical protein
MQLTRRRSRERPVRNAVDDHSASAADSFAAIVIECDGFFAALDQAFVDNVEHLEKRHVGRNVFSLVLDKLPRCFSIRLAPNS